MLAAGILPLASGTAPAAKGCMMEMVPPEKKADALSAIALIEVRLSPFPHLSASDFSLSFSSSIGRSDSRHDLNHLHLRRGLRSAE